VPRGGTGRDLGWLGGLALILLAIMVWPYAVDGHRFGVGPDVPVYLWWTRVGAAEGLSWIGSRPGAPAIAAVLAGTLNLNAAAVTAALASAMGVVIGVAAAALVRAADRASAAWWVAGLLAGVFAVHLVAGYLANLALAACFLAAAACITGRRRWWAAAMLLAGGGLAHLPFLVHGVVVMLGAAALAWRAGARDEARDIVLASAAGGLVAGAGVLATLAGPGPILAETSKDGYLRRAGLDRTLVDAYRERFRLRAARYVQWVAVPVAIVGTADAGGFLHRFLASWLVVMAVAIPVGWVTGWFPPDRIVTFGFAVPIGAALGLVWLVRRSARRRWILRAIAVGLVGWMVSGALVAWLRQAPFVSIRESARSANVLAYASAVTSQTPSTSIVFLVDEGDVTSTFLAARAANILRAASPPDRADDVYIFLGSATDFFAGRPTRRGAVQFDAISAATLAAIPKGNRFVVAMREFYLGDDVETDPHLQRLGDGTWASTNEFIPGLRAESPTRLSWGPASAPIVALATVGILAVLTVLGFGYARAAFGDVVTALAASPAFGVAAISVSAIAFDASGFRLFDVWVAFAASAVAGLGGLAVLVVQRQRGREPST
jgi:hypothetical protein